MCKRCREETRRTSPDVGFAHNPECDHDMYTMYHQECMKTLNKTTEPIPVKECATKRPIPVEDSCALADLLGKDTPQQVWKPERHEVRNLWCEKPTLMSVDQNRISCETAEPEEGEQGYESAKESSDEEVSMDEESVDGDFT